MDNTSNQQTRKRSIQYVWGLISHGSAIDRERNNISLFNVIDQITVSPQAFSGEEKTKINIPHEIALTWRRAVGLSLADESVTFACRISLVDPTGKTLEEITNMFQLQEGSRRSRQRIRVDGFVVTKPGDYVYRIELGGADQNEYRKVSEIPFEVRTKD